MTNRRQLARSALSSALRLRADRGLAVTQPISPIDLATALDLEVRFVDIPSLEGMYWKKAKPVVLLGADRPPGRQAFTCAHELGHHVFKHGTRIDEVLDGGRDDGNDNPDEYLANMFAAFLLMPKSAVDHAFAVRQLRVSSANEYQVYAIACSLGVGYGTLIRHLQLTLKSISRTRADELLKCTPKTIRTSLAPESTGTDLIVVDELWDDARSIDMQIGDLALLPDGAIVEGVCAAAAPQAGRVAARAIQPGVGRVVRGTWTRYLRVSQRRFVGRAAFRFLEDSDD